MGCTFSCRGIRAPRIFKRKKVSVIAVHEEVFRSIEKKKIASASRLMETAERQFCILSTMTFCYYESGINNHRRLSILSQVSRSKRYLISTPPEVFPDVSTLRGRDQSHSVQRQQNEWPTAERTPNNNRQNAGWYTPDVAPSTLLFLAGPKDCLEDSIPEIGGLFCNSLKN